MAKRSKLLAALDAHRGRDYKLEKQKRQQKQAEKRRMSQPKEQHSDHSNEPNPELNGFEKAHDAETHPSPIDRSENAAVRMVKAIMLCYRKSPHKLNQARQIKSSSKDDSDGGSNRENHAVHLSSSAPPTTNGKNLTSSQLPASDEDDDDEDIPLSDVESLPSEDKADIVAHQRLTINNTAALVRAHKSISAASSTPFSEHQTLTTSLPISIPDVNDDLNRELAFYEQCLNSANEARVLLKKEGVPFSRPNDYFAEMVKSDEHMGKIKQKMTDEAANKKAAVEARRQRDLKRFGKQVQVAKLQERDKAKREMLGKIEVLKKSRIRQSSLGP